MDISEISEPLPGYRLVRFLGRGSYGEAWEAVAPGNMPVAIKFIRLEQSLTDSDERELEILRKVRHAHLLDVHLVQEKGGYLLMGMPLCDQDLLGRLKECQDQGLPGIPAEELLDLMEESAKALDFLHSHNVLHRDIKPANIFLVGGTAKVADFGLARVLHHSLSTQSGLKGTPAYVAPEIVQGKGTKASDQYSLAVSYCQLRTGRFPIEADGVMALILAHVQNPPDLRGYSPQEAKVLERALAKSPGDRWPSCRDFIKELRKVVDTVPGNQSPEPKMPTPALDSPATITTPLDFGKPLSARQTEGPHQAEEERNDNGLQMPLIAIPPGTFLMGSPKEEAGRRCDEDQVNVRFTKGFWLGKFTVTQEEWLELMGSQPWNGKDGVQHDPSCPATYVSWEDAITFCQKFTEKERQAGRLSPSSEYTLPTEAQWEYACRAGTTTRFNFGNNDSEFGNYAWFAKNANDIGEKYAHPVGQKQSNAWNLFDMHGNVWEWCQDWYQEKLPGGQNPVVTEKASCRVFRGGGWPRSAESCRSAYRYGYDSSYRCISLGFRVAVVSG